MKRIIYVFLIALIFISCSTKPKVTEDIYFLRLAAERGLASANKEIAQGNFITASRLLSEYKRMAILADDSSLIARVCLSYGNALFYLSDEKDDKIKNVDKAFNEWNEAEKEAVRAKDSELVSVSKIYKARGNLMLKRMEPQAVFNVADEEGKNIKKDQFFIAFAWQTKALAKRSLGLYEEAEKAMNSSLVIHERLKSLENCSFDWYTIALIRSLDGKYEKSIEALYEAIKIDRRIENSWGLAASYKAMGDVYSNMQGKEKESREAYDRASNIYTALKVYDGKLSKEIEELIKKRNEVK